ncbi:glycerol kinase GlpK [Saprospiraceae bacterium]|nr:glycerol kinase GlpK [Saprospiraceae bacterium]MDA9866193.1 glycerol kinase GlpK [Saprospiraceae bacterium]MDB4824387.1 glycerol kinase GlpK [Saprospiraceae bacterium]MDC1306016.1 glycerol kinase GlpK [Saprospiraceae bacterium]
MSKYIIALDQGTTSCKALLVDLNGNIIHTTQKEFPQIFPKAGWVEHNANVIWETLYHMMINLLKESKVSADQILSIGITNQRETVVVWDRITGIPIYNAIVWQDKRTAAYAQSFRDTEEGEYIIDNTGLIPDAYFSGTKLKWILDQDKNRSRTLLCGTIDTWIIWKLTEGRSHYTDHTNASRTMLFNIKSLKWDQKLMDLMDIPLEILPTVLPSMADYGYTVIDGHKITINGVAGDQQSALFGQACYDIGMAKNTYGTGCFMLMNIGSNAIKSKNGLLTTLTCTDNNQPEYALEGSVFIAGAALQWLRDGLSLISNSKETEDIAYSVEEDDVVVVPAFAGLGAPYWDMSARGAIFGLTRSADSNQIIKGTLESLAYQTVDVIKAMEKDSGIEIKSLQVDGGACNNNYLMQIQSDLLNVLVERPTEVETTALGAAYLAGIQIGVWSRDIVIRNRAVERKFTPEMSDTERQLKLARWADAVIRTRGWIK